MITIVIFSYYLGMHLTKAITNLESLYILSEFEQGLSLRKKAGIIGHLFEWGTENEQLVLAAIISVFLATE